MLIETIAVQTHGTELSAVVFTVQSLFSSLLPGVNHKYSDDQMIGKDCNCRSKQLSLKK